LFEQLFQEGDIKPGFEAIIATCVGWDSGLADAVETRAVSSDIPTLIVAGQ
jgi:hypothetical protein